MNINSSSTIILCSTARLARNLNLLHQEGQTKRSLKQWSPLNILTVDQWLGKVIDEALIQGEFKGETYHFRELSNFEESLLWEKSILHTLKKSGNSNIFDLAGLAKLALEANKLIVEWELTLNDQYASEETLQFLKWRQYFHKLCSQNHYLEPIRFRKWQIECLNSGIGSLPESIVYAGFDFIHPQLASLFQTLKNRGVEVKDSSVLKGSPQNACKVQVLDEDAECRTAVKWAYDYLESNPNARVGIVVPELAKLHTKLSSLLDDVFHPETITGLGRQTSKIYDFSLGLPLLQQSLVNTGIGLLKFAWQKQSLSYPEIDRLLESPYWSVSALEDDGRAILSALLRNELPLNFTSSQLLMFIEKLLQANKNISINQLYSDIKELLAYANQNGFLALPSYWTETFKKALSVAGWPGDRNLSSHEYQAINSFNEVFSAFSKLDRILNKVSANEAIRRIKQLCNLQIFQLENKSIPAIQITGILETVAEPLDAIWVMGMNDKAWPPPPRPNALIPSSIQRYFSIPNSCSEVQTLFATKIHQRLLRSAQEIIFSSSDMDGEAKNRISPIISDMMDLNSTFDQARFLSEVLSDRKMDSEVECLDDHQGPAVETDLHVSGGTSLFRAQAICPAWAFYQYRLNAKALKVPQNGLDSMDRGNILHAALAKLWSRHPFRQLKEFNESELKSLLNAIVDEVLQELKKRRNGFLSTKFLQLESDRLIKLIFIWLTEVEFKRPMDFLVKACEEEHEVNIEGISVKLVVDRVDVIEDGSHLLIDYKTGNKVDYKNWSNTNITEPQLPIYASFVMSEKDVSAISFAKVNLINPGFVGISSADNILQGVHYLNSKPGRKVFNASQYPDWNSLLEHWRCSINSLAIGIKHGNAEIKFKDLNDLDFCEVIPILRLPERQLQFERMQINQRTLLVPNL